MPRRRDKTICDRIKPYIHAAAELPGPLWLFGGYVVWGCTTWLNTLWIETFDQNFAPWNWVTALIQAKTLCFHLFLIAILRGLVLRRPYALPLMAWFAGIQFALCGLSFINMLRNASVLIPYQYGTLSAAILGIVITGALWMLLLRYIEKSAALARIFAPGDRGNDAKSGWWYKM